jgi:hypothetical protein
LPFQTPLHVFEGDVLRVTLTTLTRREFVAWHVQKLDAAGKRISVLKQTTLRSNLLSRRQLLQANPEHRPALTKQGLMKRYALELCDEQRTVDQIVDAVHERFGDVSHSRDRVADFVVRTLANLTQ